MRKILFLFGQLSDEDVKWIAQTGQKHVVERGAMLVTEGARDKHIYIILSGRFSVYLEKGQRHLASLGSGEVVGEISMVDQRPASASVRAEETSVCLCLSQEVVRRKLHADTGLAARFYRAIAMFLADRLRGAIGGGDEDDGLSGLDREAELDDEVLENVHLASVRFNMMLAALG